jgi:hypothetical protein
MICDKFNKNNKNYINLLIKNDYRIIIDKF